jgi:enediyne biosynthesis protein E4
MRKLAFVAFVIVAMTPVARAADTRVPQFVEETKTSGISSKYMGDWQYMVGGGVGTFDCNGDGFPDLVTAGGTAPATFYVNRSKKGGTLKFKAQKSGLEMRGVTGAYPLDIDSDGTMDVVFLRVGENQVMRGLGKCRFEKANKKWNFDGGDAWSVAFAATWEKRNEWPTLAIGNYIDRTQETDPWGHCTANWLHRPHGLKAYVFDPPSDLTPSYCALSMLFTDWNRSGTPSLRVSNDREYYQGGQEQMWKIPPDQPPELYTEAEGWKFIRIWGMGIASADLDHDSYPDYFLTSMADSRLQVLAAPAVGDKLSPTFREIAFSKGVTAHKPYTGEDQRPSTGWHDQFEDVNNDGRMDLFIAKGNVDRMPDFAQKDPNNLLVQGPDGKFVEMGDKAGVASMANSRGASVADFNMDGLLDLIVVNRRESAQVWRNVTKDAGHFIGVKLEQPAPNPDAVGAWIEVKQGPVILRREITVGGGHGSGQAGWWHFGVGAVSKPQLRVIWPDGTTSEWQTLAADNFYVVSRTKPAEIWSGVK